MDACLQLVETNSTTLASSGESTEHQFGDQEHAKKQLKVGI
jgi:hypothetical protein